MSEAVEQIEDEVEVNPIETLVNQITTGELNKAEGSFQSIVQDKLASALDAERIAVAQTVFNNVTVDPDDVEVDMEIADETVEDDYEETELDGEVADAIDSAADELTDEEIEAAAEVLDQDEEILAELEDQSFRKIFLYK